MSFAAGCFVVLLLCVLAAAGFAWILAKALGWLAARGVAPGAVILVVVLGFAAYSLVQSKRNGRP
jgi:hypothetical protein